MRRDLGMALSNVRAYNLLAHPSHTYTQTHSHRHLQTHTNTNILRHTHKHNTLTHTHTHAHNTQNMRVTMNKYERTEATTHFIILARVATVVQLL